MSALEIASERLRATNRASTGLSETRLSPEPLEVYEQWVGTPSNAGQSRKFSFLPPVIETVAAAASTVAATVAVWAILAEAMQKVARPAASASEHSGIDRSRKPFDLTSEKISRLVTALRSYSGFTANWDGEGASSPDEGAIKAALKFLNFVPIGVGVPNVMLLASGEPAFYWEVGDVYAEIGFDQHGRYYAYAERQNWPPVHIDDVPVEQGIPEKVFEIIRGKPLQLIME
jgi:hypothetical protein